MMMMDSHQSIRGHDSLRRRLTEDSSRSTIPSATTTILTTTNTQQPQQPQQPQQLALALAPHDSSFPPPPFLQQGYYNLDSTTTTTTTTTSAAAGGVGVWSYTMWLGGCLWLWWMYLLLPRGFRKQYCRGQRRMYAKRTDAQMPPAGYWLPVSRSIASMSDTGGSGSGSRISSSSVSMPQPRSRPQPHSLPMIHTPPRMTQHPQQPQPSSSYHRRSKANPPSPEHPALLKIPPNRILAETMKRLQGRGIRLVAHGVHCDPKRVWIKLEDEDEDTNHHHHHNSSSSSVTWQTEFPRRVPNQSGEVSIVMMRGSLHRIALCTILYIDVGKKTNAFVSSSLSSSRLLLLESGNNDNNNNNGREQPWNPNQKTIPDATCFSLLTQNGSLDLQANSKLERDALVSCFSMILDDVHEEDWRALYEASPGNSLANSSSAQVQVQVVQHRTTTTPYQEEEPPQQHHHHRRHDHRHDHRTTPYRDERQHLGTEVVMAHPPSDMVVEI